MECFVATQYPKHTNLNGFEFYMRFYHMKRHFVVP